MTPKQLQALINWVVEAVRDPGLEYTGEHLARDALHEAFGVQVNASGELTELPPIKCERCFLERPASEADEVCRGCGGTTEAWLNGLSPNR